MGWDDIGHDKQCVTRKQIEQILIIQDYVDEKFTGHSTDDAYEYINKHREYVKSVLQRIVEFKRELGRGMRGGI